MDILLEKTMNTIKEFALIPNGSRILAGVSGGADSVALLCALHALSGELGFSLCAAHLNHGIRGEEAARDESYTKELCAKLGVELYTETLDIPSLAKDQGKTLEQAARDERYAFFARACTHFGADLIAVAHHMEDQAESILLHLLRGSGLSGLRGMQPKRENIIRPFFRVRRSEIEAYLKDNGIPWCTDSTNLSRDASRNKLRLDLIPYIEENLNSNIIPRLCSTAELIARDDEYLNEAAEKELDAAKTPYGYDRFALSKLPLSLSTRAIRIALTRAGAVTDIDRVHVERVLGMLTAPTGTHADLPHICAWISNDSLCFGQKQAAQFFSVPFEKQGKTLIPGGFFVAQAAEGDIIKGNSVAYMDMDALPESLTVRPRKDGDRFHPFGAKGSKKLKDFFIDRKVPREERNMPCLFCENEALFVPGFGISDKVKVTKDTRSILRVEYIKL